MKKRIITFVLLFAVAVLSLGNTDCPGRKPGDPPQTPEQRKQEFLSYARDVSDAVDRLQPLVARLNPAAGTIVAKAQPIARSVIKAIDEGSVANAVELLRTLIPLIDEVTAMFTDNVQVLTIAAIANIGLHFLVKYLPLPVIKATRQAAGADPILQFKQQPVWGCEYYPSRCKALK